MQSGWMTFTLVMLAFAAAPVGCGGSSSPEAASPAPEASETAPADGSTAAGADDGAEVCGEVARRAAECNVKLIPPEENPDVEEVKSEMRDTYVKQCTERTSKEPELLATSRECLKKDDNCALVDCVGEAIGR